MDEMDTDHMTKVLGDLLLAATISHVSCVPLLLETLVVRLRDVASKFSGLVPGGVYLPAPPVYCPQPARSTEVGKQIQHKGSFSLERKRRCSRWVHRECN